MRDSIGILCLVATGALLAAAAGFATPADAAQDPGVRGGTIVVGTAIDGLSSNEQAFFDTGRDDFLEVDDLAKGLGPRFNLDNCAGCHSQPAIGGSAPPANPQAIIATAFGALNVVPPFISQNGPVREVRFKFKANGSRDGGVHALFVISGRVDSGGVATACQLLQDDFAAQMARNNVSLRIPTPLFGAGLIEQIADRDIVANLRTYPLPKLLLGISGRPNRSGNDGTITRFGWKAQNKSLLLFAGEAYNVEMGITNELFQTEREEASLCQGALIPNTVTDTNAASGAEAISDIEKFAFFMRFLAPPVPSLSSPGGAVSLASGRNDFAQIGCGLCHTPSLRTGEATVTALRGRSAELFSDLVLHRMGPGLADDIVQGVAAGDEFRTAPLWGLGQRVFFLHDGRTMDLVEAIHAHRSSSSVQFGPSEANRVIDLYDALSEVAKQDLLNFLRSL